MQDVLEEIKTADDAFLSAITPKDVNGIVLEPFSLMRQAIAIEIAGLNTETAFFEAVIRVWLCTLKAPEVIKAKRDKDQAIVDAFAWAEAQGFSKDMAPLLTLYRRINQEVQHSTNVLPDTEDHESVPNSGGLPK